MTRPAKDPKRVTTKPDAETIPRAAPLKGDRLTRDCSLITDPTDPKRQPKIIAAQQKSCQARNPQKAQARAGSEKPSP